MDPQLLDFIRKAKAASETDEEIRSSLVSAGWESVEIDQAFASFQNSANTLSPAVASLPQINSMKVGLGKYVVPVVIACVLLVISITVGYVMLKSPPKVPTNVTNTPKTTPIVIPKDKPSVVSVSPRVTTPTRIFGENFLHFLQNIPSNLNG